MYAQMVKSEATDEDPEKLAAFQARIDAGEIAIHHMAGRHRRVLRSQVLAWQERFRQGQLQALKKLGTELDDEIFPG